MAVDPVTLGTSIGALIALLVSEILPFIKGTKANGIIHGILIALKVFETDVKHPNALTSVPATAL